MPITAGSTPATADPRKTPSGSIASSRALSALATTTAAAPSLIPLALPAVTDPSAANAGFREASLSALVSGRGCSSRSSLRRRPVRRRTGRPRRRPPSAAARRARTRPDPRVRPATARRRSHPSPHRRGREPLGIPGVDEPPADRRVVHHPVPARKGRIRLRGDERRAAHRLDPARDEQVTVTGDHRVTRPDDRCQPGRAQPVDGDATDRVRQPREQRREARDVPVVLPRLVRTTQPHVLDLGGRNAGALHRGADRKRCEVIRANSRERAAVAPDGRPDGREDDGLRHAWTLEVLGTPRLQRRREHRVGTRGTAA